jgi:hypothetical protein
MAREMTVLKSEAEYQQALGEIESSSKPNRVPARRRRNGSTSLPA